MAPQLLFIDQATGRVQAGNADTSAPLLLALQGTTLALRVGFVTNAIPGELPEGTTGRLVAKKELDHTGDPVLFDGDWTLDDEGTNARYEFSTLVDGVGLRALLNGKARVQLGVQIEWQVPGEDEPRKSQPFALHVLNSYAQEDDGVPDPATSAAWEWIKARLVAGTNITLIISEDGKTITIAATGDVGGSVAWGDVADKPETFPPSAHSHTTADLPLASQAEAEAGTVNNKLMTPLRVAEAIAALASGGGSSVTHAFRVYVDTARGSNLTGMMGREDKPFATLDAAWAAWEGHESYDVETTLEVVLGPGEYGLTQERPELRLRVIGAGADLTSCSIAQSGAAGADGVYGDPNGGGGGSVLLVLQSDHSVIFNLIECLAGNGGSAYYDASTSYDPGTGGVPTVILEGVTASGVTAKTGNRGAPGSGDPPADVELACYVQAQRCMIGALTAEVITGGQEWSTVGNEVQLRHSLLNSIYIVGAIGGEGSVGFARSCDIGIGAGALLNYLGCAGPDA